MNILCSSMKEIFSKAAVKTFRGIGGEIYIAYSIRTPLIFIGFLRYNLVNLLPIVGCNVFYIAHIF